MDDLISRQAAIDAVAKWFYDVVASKESDGTATIFERLKALPSAQPERKKGKWIKISPANIYECSECGKNVMTDDISAYDFCHGCGADMRTEERRKKMIKFGPPQYMLFKFSDRKKVVNKYEEWLKYRPVRNCPESFLAWMFMRGYLRLDKIMEDLKDDDEIETLLKENDND